MKECYEAIEMEIREIVTEDVITVSGLEEDVDALTENHYVDWASLI